MKTLWGLIVWIGTMLTVIWGCHWASSHEPGHEPGATGNAEDATHRPAAADDNATYEFSDRVQYLTERGLFSCVSLCHGVLTTNPARRPVVATHEHVVLNHGELVWCLNCHSAENRDALRLIDGTEVGFNESHRLCGECHGPIYRDWQFGAHGLRTGHWNGEKATWPCVRCHRPHDPEFRSMHPLAAPKSRFDK